MRFILVQDGITPPIYLLRLLIALPGGSWMNALFQCQTILVGSILCVRIEKEDMTALAYLDSTILMATMLVKALNIITFYLGALTQCEDIDECLNDPCITDAVCKNYNGSYLCLFNIHYGH